jgi:hypothetical protein
MYYNRKSKMHFKVDNKLLSSTVETEENMYNNIQQVPSTYYSVPSTFTVKDTYHFHRYYSYSS